MMPSEFFLNMQSGMVSQNDWNEGNGIMTREEKGLRLTASVQASG